MFYLVGLGLGSVKDITVKGLEIVKNCDVVYLEMYTSILVDGKDEMEEFYGRKVEIADRELVEQGADKILNEAKTKNVAFLVVGDPFGATTHTDIVLRAKQLGVEFQVVHNASILNAIGACGLQLYNFGETVSIPFWTSEWKPDSFYDKIEENRKRGMHTLCLLDIKVKEPNLDAMMRGKVVYDPPRFMTVAQAAEQLLEAISSRAEPVVSPSHKCVAVARIGSPTQQIVCCPLSSVADLDLGSPLHSLVIPGNLHPLEEEFLNMFVLTSEPSE